MDILPPHAVSNPAMIEKAIVDRAATQLIMDAIEGDFA